MLKLTQLIETYFFNKNFYEQVSIPTTASNFIPNKVVTFNEPTAGGTMLYTAKHQTYKPRHDLKIY